MIDADRLKRIAEINKVATKDFLARKQSLKQAVKGKNLTPIFEARVVSSLSKVDELFIDDKFSLDRLLICLEAGNLRYVPYVGKKTLQFLIKFIQDS